MNELTFIQPDDWHIHLRDDNALSLSATHAAQHFARAIVMPNLTPPVTTFEKAKAYMMRIKNALPQHSSFIPLMTLYLTEDISTDEIQKGHESGLVKAVKLYPKGATTNASAGVRETHLGALNKVFETLTQLQMPLLVHGEVTNSQTDIFDREKYFLEEILLPVRTRFPDLKIVLEHVTTREGIDFVRAHHNTAGTITAHHLLMNRNDLLAGGIRPHYYCLPVLKRRVHQEALIEAATSGSQDFFLGTDSAPHATTAKETACGCAGIYTGHNPIGLYLEVFEKAGALNAFEQFASINGPMFYGLPVNTTKVTYVKEAMQVPAQYEYPDGGLTPFRAGEMIGWVKLT